MITGKKLKQEVLKTSLMIEEDDNYCDAKEFAAKYGYSPSSVRQMLKRDQIAGAVKIGNKWMISEDASILVRQNSKKRCCVL